MTNTRIHLEPSQDAARQFRTAASLHSHTLYSEETLSFINRLGRQFAPLRTVIRRGEAHYRCVHGSALDLSRAWWTPPAAPHDAWMVERGQIENRLGLNALVSLTDHDSIEAPLSLSVLDQCRDTPISVEWTIPYGPTFFHFGIHNIQVDSARSTMRELAAFTASRDIARLAGLLESLAANKETLVVFNHPCWDERGVGYQEHIACVERVIRTYGQWIHAVELNGLRPWSENRAAIRLAEDFDMPIVSGGDRHALEPNTILDLTNAGTFSAYVEQVRSGHSNVLVTEQYREPFALRILQSLEEILQDHEGHGRGWVRWSDRVFYRCDDGEVRSLSTLFARRVPAPVRFFVKGIDVIRQYSVRHACRFAFPRQELAL
jgi:hypothetical protein